MDISEIRAWLQFVFLSVGAFIGIFAYIQNIKQRKIENALKMTKWFHGSIKKDDLDSWENLFRMASELAGAKRGYYAKDEGYRPLSDYFSEGSPDNGSIGKISDSLEVICYELCQKTIDARFVWFELGQLLKTIHYWLGSIESYEGDTLLVKSFPSLNKAFIMYKADFEYWPSRTYAYIE